ncbi:hypothetical protein [Streptomyces sp. NBC_01476]|nr:hypothetical protein [Streptomyces sp. NBC_01476]
MYRVFGRNRSGATVGLAVHDFAPQADPASLEADLKHWLDGVYGVG